MGILDENLRVDPVTNTCARNALRNLADFAEDRSIFKWLEGVCWCDARLVVKDPRLPSPERHCVSFAFAIDFDVQSLR
jgi:hypothetical protein